MAETSERLGLRRLDELTICAVTFGDAPVLLLNRELVDRLNGRSPFWNVVRNLPVQPVDDDLVDDTRFRVADGTALPERERALKNYRSYHHAHGLRQVAVGVGTRYAVYLDPDCFVVRPNWIQDVLEHMERERLAFFGAPYHPQWPRKVRYFPCGVLLVVDTDQIDLAGLDWTPGQGVSAAEVRRGPIDRLLYAYLQRRGHWFRLGGEISEDTGARIYRAHRGRSPAECLQPVVHPDFVPLKLRPPRERVLEKVLPDRYCLIPKRRGFVTDEGFAAHGFTDTAALGCEEFMWRGEPFALHLRGGPPALRDDLDAIRRLLDQFRP